FGGQSFMPEVLDKIRFTRELCNRLHIRQGGVQVEDSAVTKLPPFDIQVDGGINEETARLCAEAGANVFVTGTYLFGQENMKEAVSGLRKTCESHFSEKISFFGQDA